MSKTRNDTTGSTGRRLPVQLLSLAVFNSYFLSPGGKALCIPVLNCYSCPIGTVSCPIGSLTAFALLRRIPFYIIGLLGLIGLAVGRAFCGWACPFGLVQDTLYRIRTWKWRMPKIFNALKYALLVVLVLALPWILGAGKGKGAADRITGEQTGAVDYCSLVCPAGTLEGSLPYLATDAAGRARASWRTWSKIGLLAAVLGLAVVARRSFCRALCPLGALMALTSRISLLRLKTDQSKCTRCMRCVKVCPTNCRSVPTGDQRREATAECVLCLDCVRNCPEEGALFASFGGRTVSASQRRPANNV